MAADETVDHWRMRAYDLEANWSRCSRACADEQTKREQAEARAERQAEALREVADLMAARAKWEACDCGCPNAKRPVDAAAVAWIRAAAMVRSALLRDQEEG